MRNTHTHTLSLTLTHTHSLSLSLSLSLTHSLSLSLSLSLTYAQVEQTATLGSIETNVDQKKQLAVASWSFNLRDHTFCQMFPAICDVSCFHPVAAH